MKPLNKHYWEKRYSNNQLGWNIGYASTPLKTYIDQLEDKSIKILIPGAGNSYEAEYLWNNGFKNIYILDFVQQPLINFKKRVPDFQENQLLNLNFFELKDNFDLILEQTFFCALQPNLRPNYVEQMHNLLKPHGKLVGLLFNFELTEEGPPFGGSITEYKSHFNQKFNIKVLEPSINSIKERQGKELFFIFQKK
ncbi:thiopurine S-methyltransferase [Winogradskyella epiphytica]|uniref:Thiopurine S-methyltransferase n=1 Tax=Winogradskyella epiphytica TaxID=262005 RepID=A0A2V4X5J6_9FLAO|nr:methyltransferase domain-containing protein [Winogradskyella epiphytica]PYE80344.1 thiopurine S-methyltransferase [Winogradskyella epiphytica]GGW70687.1 SAM-dependent methyltransferase [Winogradskyella epiphytica]